MFAASESWHLVLAVLAVLHCRVVTSGPGEAGRAQAFIYCYEFG